MQKHFIPRYTKIFYAGEPLNIFAYDTLEYAKFPSPGLEACWPFTNRY